MIERRYTTGSGYRPLLLTTKTLYPRWEQLLWEVRMPEHRSLILVLPQGSSKTRACLLAIAKQYEARGGAVRVIEGSPGVERYYEVRRRLTTGSRRGA